MSINAVGPSVIEHAYYQPGVAETGKAGASGEVQNLDDVAAPPPTSPSRWALEIPAPKDAAAFSAEMSEKFNAADANALVDFAAIMMLLHQIAVQQRQQAREDRATNLEAQMTALADAAAKMRDAAVTKLVTGVVTGAIQIGAGVVSVGAGALSVMGGVAGAQAATKAAAGAGSTAAGVEAGTKATENATSVFTGMAKVWEGQTKIIDGGAGIVRSGGEAGAAMTEAEKAELDRLATLYQSAREKADEYYKDMKDFIQDLRGKLSELEQSMHDINKSIIRA